MRTTHNPVYGYEADRAITLEDGRIVMEENWQRNEVRQRCHPYAAGLPRLLKEDFTNTMKLLRDKNFQELLYPYSRRKRTFIIAHENQDSALT